MKIEVTQEFGRAYKLYFKDRYCINGIDFQVLSYQFINHSGHFKLEIDINIIYVHPNSLNAPFVCKGVTSDGSPDYDPSGYIINNFYFHFFDWN